MMRPVRFRDPKQLRPFCVTMAAVEEKKLRVVAINETKAVQEARKKWASYAKPTAIERQAA